MCVCVCGEEKVKRKEKKKAKADTKPARLSGVTHLNLREKVKLGLGIVELSLEDLAVDDAVERSHARLVKLHRLAVQLVRCSLLPAWEEARRERERGGGVCVCVCVRAPPSHNECPEPPNTRTHTWPQSVCNARVSA